MRMIILLLSIAYANGFYVNDAPVKKDRIVGGDFVEIEKVPYQASLFEDGEHFCGGTIISKTWIVTAGHCLDGTVTSRISVRTGSGHRLNSGTRYRIAKVIVHPNFDPLSLDNDIALIKLRKPIVFNDVQKAISIAKPTDIPERGQLMLVSGFGQTGDDEPQADFLKAVLVPVVYQTRCKIAYGLRLEPLTSNMFCAGDSSADSCQGDSGGPAVVNNKLYGVVSFGPSCGSQIFPGVYTRVHIYHDWIVEKTGLKL